MSPKEFESKYDEYFEKAKIELDAKSIINKTIDNISGSISNGINDDSDFYQIIENAMETMLQIVINMDVLNRNINKEVLKRFLTEDDHQ